VRRKHDVVLAYQYLGAAAVDVFSVQQQTQLPANIHHRNFTSSTNKTECDTHTHTTVLRSFFPELPGWAGAKIKSSSGLYGAKGDIRGRHTNHPTGHHSIWTNQQSTLIIPPFLCRMPFLPQPSQFMWAWGRHQICWLAYPVAWFRVWDKPGKFRQIWNEYDQMVYYKWHKTSAEFWLEAVSLVTIKECLIDWVNVLCPTWHKIGHFGDVLPSQSLGIALKKLNLTH